MTPEIKYCIDRALVLYKSDGIDAFSEKLSELIINECAIAAELAARSFSDGDASSGCAASARAVRSLNK